MTPRIVVSLFAVATLFGVTACSETPSDTSATTTPTESAAADPTASETTESAEPTDDDSSSPATGEQSVAEACTAIAEPMTQASEELRDVAASTTDPEAAVEAWSTVVEAYESAADNVSNAEVEAAVNTASEDLAELRDALQKAYVEKDADAMGLYTDAVAAFQESQTELMDLCAG